VNPPRCSRASWIVAAIDHRVLVGGVDGDARAEDRSRAGVRPVLPLVAEREQRVDRSIAVVSGAELRDAEDVDAGVGAAAPGLRAAVDRRLTAVPRALRFVRRARMDRAHADGVIDPRADGARQRRYPYAADILAPLSVGRAAAHRQSCERQHARRRHRQQRAGAGGG